jgi:hypothetical protein
MKNPTSLLFGLALASLAPWAAADAGVSFLAPTDGAVVSSPVQVRMAVTGMTVQPAGELKEGTGHHHLIINGAPLPAGTPVPADPANLHFGKGQTETSVTLPPGKHTLTLQFADGLHQSYGPQMSQTIEIEVK